MCQTELWEMACARHLGLVNLPIACINVDNYYQPFQDMLDRSYQDRLIRLKPSEIVHFANSVQEAVEWCEVEAAKNQQQDHKKKLDRRSSALNKSSFYSAPPMNDSNRSAKSNSRKGFRQRHAELGLAVTGGIFLGASVCFMLTRR